MPLLTIRTNTRIDNANELAQVASKKVADILAKPESYVMVHVMPEQALVFAGTNDGAALLELKSLGLNESGTGDLSAALCELINSELGIDIGRVYIEFSNPDRHMWGWKGGTF